MRRSRVVSLVLILVAVLAAGIGRAFAHSPHDDVDGLELSSAYATDQTAYAVVRGNFFKTVDGGNTWQRKVTGLDNRIGFNSLTISPQSDAVLYMASRGDGVYKSVDGGERWVKVNQGLGSLEISEVVAAKNSADLVLAVGNTAGLYRTEDGGQSWQTVELGLAADTHLVSAAFVSATSTRVYAGDERGNLYLSDDLGLSWSACCTMPVEGAITGFAFVDDQTFFVATNRGGLFKTTDGGQSLTAQNQGIPSKYIQSVMLSPDYATDHTLYAITRHQGIFRSQDEGATWSAVNHGLHTNPQALHYQRPSFSSLRITKESSGQQTLFISTFTGIYKSENEGVSWAETETLLNQIIVGLAIAPSNNGDPVVGFNHYLGDSYLMQADQTRHLYVQRGLPGMDPVEDLIKPLVDRFRFGTDTTRLLSGPSRLHDIAFSPDFLTDKTAFMSFQNYLLRTTDGGHSWKPININQDPLGLNEFTGNGEDYVGYMIALSPNFAQDNTLFLGTEEGLILKSTDRGTTVAPIGSIDDRITGLHLSPNYTTDQTIFAASFYRGVHKSVDGGATWQSINNGIAADSGAFMGEFQLGVSPNYGADQTLLVGTVVGLFKSTDGGAQWQKVTCDGCDPNWNVAALAISPAFATDGTVLIAAKGHGLFKSTDGGNTFVAIQDSLLSQNVSMGNLEDSPATSGAIKFSPNYANDQLIYGFSATTLVRSTDGGETWSIVPNPDPNAAPDLQINLVIGTNLVYPIVLFGTPLLGIVLIIVIIWLVRRMVGGRTRRQPHALRVPQAG